MSTKLVLVLPILPIFILSSVSARVFALSSQDRYNVGWSDAEKIAERYMGKSKAQEYGKRNSGEGEVLVRITSKRIIAERDAAA